MSSGPKRPDAPEGFRFLDEPEKVPELPGRGAAGRGDASVSAHGLSLELEGGKTSFQPGEELTCTVSWDFPSTDLSPGEAEPPEALELRLFWYTEGRGNRDVGLVETERLAPLGTTGDREVTFRLPGGPYSFSGPLISLIWAVEVVTEPDLRTLRREIVVGPEGREVRLRSLEEVGTGEESPLPGPEG